ncbi:MAG TPA: tetratricopeptide repeat protein [Kofleriaceae bacterium]|nr:tetratricopeptide repeat protein [Kofleriaceae bacterium]
MTQEAITPQRTRRAGALLALAVLVGSLGLPQPAIAGPNSPTPQADLDEATRLDKEVESLYRGGKFQEAVPLAERSLKLREKALGPTHPLVAASLNNLGLLYQEQGAYARTEPLLVRALAIWEKALGAMHPDVAASLNNLAGLYQAQGAYARAEPLLVRALAIWEKALGAMHPDVAVSLNNLAMLYLDQGAYVRAEPLLARALAIREKSLGAMHPDVATSLNNLAALYQAQGAYARAEPLYVRALAILEKALGAMHPDVALSLNNLAALYEAQSTYARAEPLYVRALAILEKTLGAMHPNVALSLNNLAALYREQGAYARAEPLLDRALAIREKTLGAMHPDVANSLDNLALLYKTQGAYARAEPLYVRALAIREKTLGAMHPDVAISLNNLATVYRKQVAYARAEPLLVRALAIGEKALGAMHPDVALSLNSLAALYSDQGAYARAEPLLVRALAIREKALGTMHPEAAQSLNDLALLYRDQGVYTRAEPLLVRALAIWEKALGPMHPDVATSLNSLASFYQAQGAYVRAEPLYARAAESQEAYLRVELVRLSESRKRDLMKLLYRETLQLVSFHAHALPTSARALDLALTAVLRRKGRILDSLTDNQAALRAHLTPQLRAKLDELADAKSELSTRLRAPYQPRTAPAQTAALAALRSRIDDLEAELNAASIEYRVQSEPVTVAKVQAALPLGAALVELVRYNRYDPRQPKPKRWQEARYLAYLLPWQGPPRWIPLGDAATVDARIDAVLATMHKGASAEATRTALRRLDAVVWTPIRDQLAGVSHVILSPDGKLNLVPFEALIDPQGHYALEQWLISYVTSGRDLLRLAARPAPRAPATIVADPDYGPGPLFARLPGVQGEAVEVAAHLPDARLLTGAQATKAALAGVVGPAVLHVATHGFYARGATTPAPPAGPVRGMNLEDDAPLAPPTTEDPTEALDRAGLALAGANSRPDGIASARELAGYDWWGTALVVLSACQTGVGEVASGEGVYSLRRALVLAGAQAQVVSLWNVSDASARALMRALYSMLARGIGRAQALRQAKLALLRQPQFAHPYYWAAFIAAGDWTPLDPDTLRQRAPSP